MFWKTARRPISLASRLTLLHGALVLLLMVTFVLSLRTALLAQANSGLEDSFQDRFDRLHKYRALFVAEGDPSDNRVALRAIAPDGTIVFESLWMRGPLPASAFPPPGGRSDRVVPDGRHFTLRQAVREGWTYQLGQDQSDVYSIERSTYVVTALIGVPALLLTVATGYVLTRIGLSPVRRLAAQVAAVRPTPAGSSLEIEPMPSELEPLRTSFISTFARLSGALARLDGFAGDVAHELRTPLQRLRTSAELGIVDGRGLEAAREALAGVVEEADRLKVVIERFLLLARLEDARAGLKADVIDVQAQLATLIDFFEPSAAAAGVTIELVCPAALHVIADTTLLERATSNLVSNALRHTPSGGAVVVEAGEQPGSVWIRVVDTGQGMPADLLEAVQGPLRARAPISTGGAGLGLRIVRRVAELHGGRLVLDNPPGKGLCATIELSKMTPMSSG